MGGPILRYFGLTVIKIETAGGGGGNHNQNMMSMLGINDAESFKTDILLQREKVIHEKNNSSNQSSSSSSDTQLLMDIKNELIEIKNKMKG
jgi:putative membrane protein